MNRIAARIAVTVAVATVLFGTLATTAMAGILDVPTPIGWSSSNPGALDGEDSWWRGGWGTTASPDYKLNTPTMLPGVQLIGFNYLVDSSADTTLGGPSIPRDRTFFSAMPTGTHTGSTLDLQAALLYPPITGPHPLEPGAASSIEGHWYLHYIFVDNIGETGTPITVFFGVDNTKPRAVTGLAASPTDSAWPAGQVSPTSRVKLTWDLNQYDDMAGVAYYQVYIDGKPVIPESATTPTQGRVYELLSTADGYNPPVIANSVTIENAPAGTHTYSIACVDRARNEGPQTSVVFTTDPDVPVVSWAMPTGNYVGLNQQLMVNVTDNGGIKSVNYKMDGVNLGTSTASPYAITSYMGAFANGTHTLTATVTDNYGRVVTISKTVTLDKLMLTVSRFSRTPQIFYPIRRDGYYDNSYIYYRLNKSAKVTLTIRNSAGTIVRTLSTTTGSGSHRFVWNGKWASDGKAHTGRYYYKITAVDNTGRSVSTGSLTTWIRNYQLKRISRSMVKVIPR